MRIYLFYYSLIVLLLFVDPVRSQSVGSTSSNISSSWTTSPFEQFVFIENKGQFDNKPGVENNRVLYSTNIGGLDVYFTTNGLTYVHEKAGSLFSEGKKERLERKGKEEELRRSGIKTIQTLSLEWLGANRSSMITPEAIQSFYYTYSDTSNKTIRANACKKITFKNLYPNIDVEYILPEKGGIKYTLILHPGADLSRVKMQYINAKGLISDSDHNIVIKSEFGDFIDHAPISFYADNHQAISSSFSIKNNIVSFNLHQPGTPVLSAVPAGRQETEALNFKPACGPNCPSVGRPGTIVIDPWTSSPTFPLNKAFDVNYDLQGNVYVYGSNQQFKLAKFNSSGVLQWIYTNPNTASYQIYGDFAVDEYTGTSYVVDATGSRFYKINTLGVQTGIYISSITLSFQMNEFWRCEYNHCLNKIVIGGGGTFGTYQAAMLDTNMTTLVPVNVLNATQPYNDIVSLTIDPTGSFCYMTTAEPKTQPGTPNRLLKCPIPTLAPTSFSVNNGYTFKEVTSVNFTPTSSFGEFSNGFNGLACGPSFLYSYDGSTLKKWNKTTGALIAQINTGGIMFASGGLSADKCDNVYTGVGNVIKVYNSSLTQVATYNVPNTCYDLKLGLNNKLYACGNGFVTEIMVSPLSQPGVTSTPASTCNACNGTATALSCAAPSGYKYLWNPGGQTTQTATGLCPGIYTVSIITNCSIIDTVSVSVTGGTGGITLSSIQTNICSGTGTATLTASGGAAPYQYLWSNGQTAAMATNLITGNYTVTATDVNGCSSFKIIKIINNISLSFTPKYTKCVPGNTGSIALNVSGGTPSYLYNWNNGQTGQISTGLSTGIYSVTVTDGSGCTATISVPINNPPLEMTTSVVNDPCGLNSSASVTVTAGVPAFTYSWSNGQTTSSIKPLVSGAHTVTVTDSYGCIATRTFNLTYIPPVAPPEFTISPDTIVCVGTTVNFTPVISTGTHDWQVWQPLPGYATIGTGSAPSFSFTFTTIKNYYRVYHRVTIGSCTAMKISTVSVKGCTGPTVAATGSSVCAGSCATINASGTGGTSPYTYNWSNGATTQNINPCPTSTTTYTVTIRDTGGNSSTSTAVVTINPAVTVTTTVTNITCSGASTGSATAAGGGGTPGYTFQWSNLVSGSVVSGLSAGNYTVTVTDNKGCTGTSTAAIVGPKPLEGQFTKGTANCNGCGCKEWIMVTASGGTRPYTYLWPDGYVNRYKNQLCPGSYSINIKDKNDCSVNVNLTAP